VKELIQKLPLRDRLRVVRDRDREQHGQAAMLAPFVRRAGGAAELVLSRNGAAPSLL
jgi:hypothetical protein